MVLATMQWESVKAQENKSNSSDTTEYVRISLIVAGPGTAVKWQKLLAQILFNGKADESRSKTDKLVVPNDIVDAFRRAGLIMDEKVLE